VPDGNNGKAELWYRIRVRGRAGRASPGDSLHSHGAHAAESCGGLIEAETSVSLCAGEGTEGERCGVALLSPADQTPSN
jgi:hypothetical protein